MPKKPLSVTLDDTNLLWLRGRAAGRKNRSLSEALDQILTEARTGGSGADPARSVVGSIDIADDDPMLDRADAALASIFDDSLGRPFLVRETSGANPEAPSSQPGVSKRRG